MHAHTLTTLRGEWVEKLSSCACVREMKKGGGVLPLFPAMRSSLVAAKKPIIGAVGLV